MFTDIQVQICPLFGKEVSIKANLTSSFYCDGLISSPDSGSAMMVKVNAAMVAFTIPLRT
jgi:hypothetical protein